MSEPVFTEVQCSCGAIIGSRIVAFAKAVKSIQNNPDAYNYQEDIAYIRLAGNQHSSSLIVGQSPASGSTTTVVEVQQESTDHSTTSKTTTYVHTEMQDRLITPVGKLLSVFGAQRDCCRQRLMTAYVFPKSG